MKLLELQFYFFCSQTWGIITVTITAQNRFQLLRAFVAETKTIYERRSSKTESQLRKELWERIQMDIDTFSLPYVHKKL